jgi:hypothetical protein
MDSHRRVRRSLMMQRVDLLRAGDRLADQDTGDLTQLVRIFNGMLDRLEAEQRRQRSGADGPGKRAGTERVGIT